MVDKIDGDRVTAEKRQTPLVGVVSREAETELLLTIPCAVVSCGSIQSIVGSLRAWSARSRFARAMSTVIVGKPQM